jgi:hypothetical protein
VVQLYKNIQEAEAGKSTWTPNGLPSFPLVVTLEDWFIFGPLTQDLLMEKVTNRMQKAGVDLALLEEMPYAIASAREFERFTGVIKEVGIQVFFERKRTADYPRWMWEEYAWEECPTAKRTDLQALFKKDWLRIIPIEAIDALV